MLSKHGGDRGTGRGDTISWWPCGHAYTHTHTHTRLQLWALWTVISSGFFQFPAPRRGCFYYGAVTVRMRQLVQIGTSDLKNTGHHAGQHNMGQDTIPYEACNVGGGAGGPSPTAENMEGTHPLCPPPGFPPPIQAVTVYRYGINGIR